MFKKIVVSSMGYPGVALAYWLRLLSPRVSIVTPDLSVIEDTTSPRRWGHGIPFYSRRYVEDVLGVEEGEEGDVYVEIQEPLIEIEGVEMPLYRASTFKAMASSRPLSIRGPGAEQIEYYVNGENVGRDAASEAEIIGETSYRIACEDGEVVVSGGIFEENVEQAAAEAAMRILGLPSGSRVRFQVVERGGVVDFVIGVGGCEHSTRAVIGGCSVRICVEGDAVASVSGSRCCIDVLGDVLMMLLERHTADWMPLLAAAWSPLLDKKRRFAPLVGLWRKTLPRRILQLGEIEGLCVFI